MRVAIPLLLATGALILSALPVTAHAQNWLSKPVKLVVPFPPGGALDLMARLVGQAASESLGQPILVENRPGADSIIGAELVARAAPDGHTLLVGNASSHGANVYMYRNKKLSYDPIRDFAPITGAVESITCIAVPASLPVRNLKEFIDYAKQNAAKLSWASSGTGGAYHLTGLGVLSLAGVEIQHIPYKGLAPALTALVAGEIQMTSTALGVTDTLARSGKIRILAVTEGHRYSGMPEVPAVVEILPEYRSSTVWSGFFAPAGTPRAVVMRLNADLLKGLNSPAVRSKLEATEVIGGTPEQFGEYMKGQIETYARLATLANIAPH